MNKPSDPKRGELWLVDLEPTRGSEIQKTRPAYAEAVPPSAVKVPKLKSYQHPSMKRAIDGDQIVNQGMLGQGWAKCSTLSSSMM